MNAIERESRYVQLPKKCIELFPIISDRQGASVCVGVPIHFPLRPAVSNWACLFCFMREELDALYTDSPPEFESLTCSSSCIASN